MSTNKFSVRMNYFDSLKFILAILIVLWHSAYILENFKYYNIFKYLFVPGRYIVWFFYIISGYLIGRTFYSGKYTFSSIKTYYYNRVLRILPLFYISYILIWVILYAFDTTSLFDNIKDLLFLRYDFTKSYIYNGTAWFLGPLIQMYILAPFIFIYLMKLDDRKFKRNFLILILFILFLKYLNYVIVGNFDDRTMLGNIGLFIIGGYINKFPHNLKYKVYNLYNPYVIWLYVILISVFYYTRFFWYFPSQILVLIVSVFLIIKYESADNSLKIQTTNSYYLNNLSYLSYGIYLWHVPIITILNETNLQIIKEPLIFMLLLFSITLGISHISYKLIEAPFYKFKVNCISQKR